MNVKKLLTGLVAISSLAAAHFAHAEVTIAGANTQRVQAKNVVNVVIGAEAEGIQNAASIVARNGQRISIGAANNQSVELDNAINVGIGYKVIARQSMASISAE